MKGYNESYIFLMFIYFVSFNVFAQNSIVRDQFLASEFNSELEKSFEKSDFKLKMNLDGALREKVELSKAKKTIDTEDKQILVRVYPAKSVTLNKLHKILKSAGVNSKFIRISGALEGYLKIVDIDNLTKDKRIGAIVEVQTSTDVGLETSEGDKAMETDRFRLHSGLSGAGIKVGVISNSFDCRDGASASRGIDIPLNASAIDEGPCSQLSSLESDEGRAMMEIIYDIAPSSEMIFSTGYGGVGSHISSIDKLIAQGVNLIVDDVNHYTEPWFQKGELYQKIQSVVEGGVHYITSAGNINGRSTAMPFEASPTQPIPALGQLHRWKNEQGQAETDFLTFSLSPGQRKSFIFQWTDPWRIGESTRGPQSDFALVVINLRGQIVSIADIDNINSGIAFESVALTNPSTTNTVLLAIGVFKRSGPDPEQIQILSTQGAFNTSAARTTTPTILGAKNSDFPIVVGASNYDTVDNCGCSSGSAEVAYYSSRGGQKMYFDEYGNSIQEKPLKPDVVGPDGVATTFFGFDSDGDGRMNFRGTSASAPHIAGLVSLLLEHDKDIRPDYMKTLLRNTIDMDDPLTDEFDTGFDWGTGYGFVDAISVYRQFLNSNRSPVVSLQSYVQVPEEDLGQIVSLVAEVSDDGLPWGSGYKLSSHWELHRGNSSGYELETSNLQPHELKIRFLEKGYYTFNIVVSDSERTTKRRVTFIVK